MGNSNLFQLEGKSAVVTGGAGVLGSVIAGALAEAGAKVIIAARPKEKADRVAEKITASGGSAKGVFLDVFDEESIHACCDAALDELGQIDILINAVGGNMKDATTSPELSFFDMSSDAIRKVMDLNVMGGVIAPSQVFGARMKDNENGGSIINISSMNAFRPLTRIPGYSAAKAAVSNFTQWLSVHLAQEYNTKLRVNAIAPGFFLTEQNRFLLTDQGSGELTARGGSIIAHTPMGSFGEPEDLIGTMLWLASDASRFVTGIVVPVDGGFSAFSGV